MHALFWHFKVTLLSKALTCIKNPVQQKWPFCQGDKHLWLYNCTNNLYISHKSLNAPTYNFFSTQQRAYQSFLATSWFGSVCIIVTRWVNFREKTFTWTLTTAIRLQSMSYQSIFIQMYTFLVELFPNFFL